MDIIESIFGKLADFLWGDWLLFALVGLGIYYTVMTGFIQLRCLFLIPKGVFGGGRRKAQDKEKCSSYQALCTAIASCVGSGNIVGVSTAVLSGGPGALFWMWMAAFFGMATKFGEITLGVRYHGRDGKGNIAGGPMYYIANGLNWKGVGALVAALLFIQNCGATLIQSNTISQVAQEAFHIPVLAAGIALAVLMSLIISGGFKRLVQVAQNVAPFMAGLYLLGGLLVLLVHAGEIPAMFASIFKGAFTLKAGSGALAGLAGAYVSMGQLSSFTEDMIAGRGFIALAAVVLGNYMPGGVLAATLIFGAASALQYRMQATAVSVPYQFWLMLPYIITIIAICLYRKSSNQAASSGKPYDKH